MCEQNEQLDIDCDMFIYGVLSLEPAYWIAKPVMSPASPCVQRPMIQTPKK